MGDDVISGESDEDALFGEAGADVLMGGNHDDYLDGGAGRDFLNGNRGHDALIGGTGDDALEGESGKDLLVGGEGQDIGNGGSGNDVIFGDQYSASLQRAFGDNLTPLSSLYIPDTAPETFETNTEEIYIVEPGQDPLFMEAEAMTLTGDFQLNTLASGEILVQSDSETTLATTFSGTTGMYDLVISYHDVLGTSQINVNVNEVALDSWLLNKDLGGRNPADKNLTSYVIRDVLLNEGDSFSLESIRDKKDKGYIDSVQFIPVNEMNNSTSNLVLDSMRVEAETLNWTGITKIDDKSFASGSSYLFNNSKNSTINTSTTFTGESGLYNVVLGYYDSNKGEAQVTVDLNGTALDTWSLDLDIDDNAVPLNFVTRTIGSGLTLNQGDTLEIEGIRYDDDDKVFLDFIEFVPYNPHARIKIEAEYFNLTGDYKVEEEDFASGGRLFKSDSNVNATTAFRGLSGYYDLVIGYYDSNNGEAQLTASLAGSELDSWLFDLDLGTKNAETTSFVTRKLAEGVMVNEGDILELQGIRDSDDKVYIDYVEFVPVEAPVETPPEDTPSEEDIYVLPLEVELGANSDILTGGAGNDGIDGGEGNDIIFGEDKLNDSRSIYAPFIDGAFTYGHSSYILSQAATLEEVEAEAQSYGGYLVTINDTGEKQWLMNTFGFDTNNNYVIEIDWSSIGGNDTILGGAGDDQIYGNTGNDLLYGDTSKIPGKLENSETSSFQYSRYLLTDSTMTWTDAQAYAESIGGNLVTINDALEERWLQQTFGNTEELWIGLTDKNVEGQFEWISGEAVTYTNWHPGEPNNGNGTDSDYVRMNYENQWGDKEDILLRGIIEIKLPTTTSDNDRITGIETKLPTTASGNDRITGNGGHDMINGGAGDDVLNGTDEVVAGYLERDVLIGDTGADKFILGDETQAYYATGGDQDYAVIQDFNVNLDTLQLYGSAMDYQQVQHGNDTHLTRNGDLVVILENNNTLNLDANAFEYISTV